MLSLTFGSRSRSEKCLEEGLSVESETLQSRKFQCHDVIAFVVVIVRNYFTHELGRPGSAVKVK